MAHAHLALLLANLRYWPTVAPLVHAQIESYKQRAGAIRNPTLQAIALDKLDDQHFHAQVAATLATLAPRAHRKHAVRAIVAVEVIYDYFDGLTEQSTPDPLGDGHQLAQAFTDAVNIDRPPTGHYYTHRPQTDDYGYLPALVNDAREALAQLPANEAITPTATRCATRFGEAQVRAHAIPQLGSTQLQEWATHQAHGTGLGWLEYFAGATSTVLGLHALIAAAANPHTTPGDAQRIDTLYLYIGVIVTMLDSIIDYQRDIDTTGQPGYTRYYENREQFLQALTNATRQVIDRARDTPNAAHHLMTLVGVVAFYTTAPTAASAYAAPITAHIQRQLRPLITPTLAVMRAWRAAKHARHIATRHSTTL